MMSRRNGRFVSSNGVTKATPPTTTVVTNIPAPEVRVRLYKGSFKKSYCEKDQFVFPGKLPKSPGLINIYR